MKGRRGEEEEGRSRIAFRDTRREGWIEEGKRRRRRRREGEAERRRQTMERGLRVEEEGRGGDVNV